MNSSPQNGTWLREELRDLLALSATLAGFCITGVTLFHTLGRASLPETIADDMLAISALLFLVCTSMFFFTLRTRSKALALTLQKIADTVFLLALGGMTLSGCIMVYTVW